VVLIRWEVSRNKVKGEWALARGRGGGGQADDKSKMRDGFMTLIKIMYIYHIFKYFLVVVLTVVC